jgi:hypothetical protein
MIYLYRFSLYSKPRGGVLVNEWTHTSYEKPISHPAYPGVVFTPLAGLTHSEIRYDQEKNAGQLKVTTARDFPVSAMFLGGYPYGSIYLRVIELESEDADALAQVIWLGRIRSCDHQELTAELTGTDGREMLQRLGLRLNAGSSCQWDLYGTDCGAVEATYTRTGAVVAISPNGLEVTTDLVAPAYGWFKAGKFRARGQARMVTKSVGSVLTLMSAIPGLAVGDAVQASKGCDRSGSATSGCKSFNNYANYSGFEGFETPKNIFAEGA